MSDRIGTIDFLRIDGTPLRAHLAIEVSQRAGVNGTAFRSMGQWGEGFVLRSTRFGVTYANCQQQYRDALTLIGLTATVEKGGLVEPNQYYMILKVLPVDIRKIVRGKIANDSTVYGAICVLDWFLWPVDPAVQSP